MINFLPKLVNYYPDTKYVVIVRQWRDVFNSLLNKGWFNDYILKSKAGYLSWPNIVVDGKRVPFWVSKGLENYWLEKDEINKIAFYYMIMSYTLLKVIDNCIIVDYDELIENPNVVVKYLSTKLNCKFGGMTEKIITTIERKTNNPYIGKGLNDYTICRLDNYYEEIIKKAKI